jgi:hypothetical protein
VEIDPVGHESGNPRGEFCFTLTVTEEWAAIPT